MLDAVAGNLDDLAPAILGHAHRKLDAPAREHPEQTAPRTGNRERQQRMANEKQGSFRLPAELVDKFDAHARRMQEATPGMSVTRADVVGILLTRGLAGLPGRQARKGKERR